MADRIHAARIEHSYAIVPYKPSTKATKMADIVRRSFALQREEHRLFHKPARVTVLIGSSTAGKTSIISRMKLTVAGMKELGCDIHGDTTLLNYIKQNYPLQYEFLQRVLLHARGDKHILDAIGGDIFRFKDGVSAEDQEQAKEIARALHDPIDRVVESIDFERSQMLMMDEALMAAEEGVPVIFDILDIDRVATRMLGKVPLTITLVYCPINILAERVFERNRRAIAEDNLSEVRLGIFPIAQMAALFKPKTSEEEVPLFTLTRAQLIEAFELLFNQWATDPSQAAKGPMEIEKERKRLMGFVLEDFGFADPSVTEVEIVPKFNGYDCIIDTTTSKPWDSVRVLTAESQGSLRSESLEEMLPPLTGRYHVGCTSLHLTDIPRVNPLTGTATSGPLGMQIYLPTTIDSEEHMPLVIAGEKVRGFTHSHPLSVETMPSTRRYPVVIFSHGGGFDPAEYRPLLEELASHGVICIALDHPVSSASGIKDPAIDSDLSYDQKSKMQAEDMKQVLARLRAGTLHPKLSAIADLSSITVAGHSLGGAAAVDVAREDPALKACVNLDGALRGAHRQEGIATPVLTILSGENLERRDAETAAMRIDWDAFSASSHTLNPRSHSEIISGVGHEDFSIYPFMQKLEGKKIDTTKALIAHERAASEMVRFIFA